MVQLNEPQREPFHCMTTEPNPYAAPNTDLKDVTGAAHKSSQGKMRATNALLWASALVSLSMSLACGWLGLTRILFAPPPVDLPFFGADVQKMLNGEPLEEGLARLTSAVVLLLFAAAVIRYLRPRTLSLRRSPRSRRHMVFFALQGLAFSVFIFVVAFAALAVGADRNWFLGWFLGGLSLLWIFAGLTYSLLTFTLAFDLRFRFERIPLAYFLATLGTLLGGYLVWIRMRGVWNDVLQQWQYGIF
jgi:hypothetical protein